MKHVRWTLALLAILALSTALSAQVQDQAKPEDAKKLYLEIAGDYTFDFQGQAMVVQFFEKDGQFFGAPVGETPEQIFPVKDKPLAFDVTVAANGQYYFLQFVRDDKGVIFKCVMTVEGMTIEGLKTIK